MDAAIRAFPVKIHRSGRTVHQGTSRHGLAALGWMWDGPRPSMAGDRREGRPCAAAACALQGAVAFCECLTPEEAAFACNGHPVPVY